MDMNNVNLIGRLTRDIELKQAGATTVGKFTLACNRMKKDEVDFINCIAFGKTAENMATYINKGRQVAITGHIQTGKYTNKDGQTVFTTDIVVDRFYFIGTANSSQNSMSNVGANDYMGGLEPVDDGDMPF